LDERVVVEGVVDDGGYGGGFRHFDLGGGLFGFPRRRFGRGRGFAVFGGGVDEGVEAGESAAGARRRDDGRRLRNGLRLRRDGAPLFPPPPVRPPALSLSQIAREGGYRMSGLCDRIYLSERHLRRVFEEGIGIAPKDWLRQERMVAARSLLREGSPIKEVAIDLGFTTAKMFSRDFQ